MKGFNGYKIRPFMGFFQELCDFFKLVMRFEACRSELCIKKQKLITF
jgi:hypothetical protein